MAVRGQWEQVTLGGDGVLGAGRGGGLRAVAAGAVQGVSAGARAVRIQPPSAQRESQLLPRRLGLQRHSHTRPLYTHTSRLSQSQSFHTTIYSAVSTQIASFRYYNSPLNINIASFRHSKAPLTLI